MNKGPELRQVSSRTAEQEALIRRARSWEQSVTKALGPTVTFPLDSPNTVVRVCAPEDSCQTSRNMNGMCSLRMLRHGEWHVTECWANGAEGWDCKNTPGLCPVGLCDEHHETICDPS